MKRKVFYLLKKLISLNGNTNIKIEKMNGEKWEKHYFFFSSKIANYEVNAHAHFKYAYEYFLLLFFYVIL